MKYVLCALLVVGFAVTGQAQDKFNRDFVDALNAFRAENGVGPVEFDQSLADAGQLQCDILKGTGWLVHVEPVELSPLTVDMNGDGLCDFYDRSEFCGWVWGPVSENGGVKKGGVSGLDAVWAWANSPGHRANMLNPNWTHAGIGSAPWGAGRKSYFAVFGEDLRLSGD